MCTHQVVFREIHFGSDAFRQVCELRDQVLRVPLGLNLYDEDLARERDQLHFGLFDPDGLLVACVIAAPESATAARIRQMAVRTESQNQGHGRELMSCLEADLFRRGFTHLNLHARLSAVGFYEKLGYTRSGHEFMEVGIPHLAMEKDLVCAR